MLMGTVGLIDAVPFSSLPIRNKTYLEGSLKVVNVKLAIVYVFFELTALFLYSKTSLVD